MDTTPAMDAALSGDQVTIFLCGKAELPGYNLQLLEGSGSVTWSQGTFTGLDATFGSIGSIEAINDGIGNQAPQISITLLPPDGVAPALLSSPNMQGSRIRIWLGAIDNATRAVVATPYLLFDGELDQPVLSVDKGTVELDYECVSAFERLFRGDEGFRLSDTHQQEVWPGETGLQDVTGVVKQIIWGPGEQITGSFAYSPASGGSFGPSGASIMLNQVNQ